MMRSKFRQYALVADCGALTLKQSAVQSSILGPFSVRVRIRAVSLNDRDLRVAHSAPGLIGVNLVPLSDAAGDVMEIGSAVRRVRVGEQVAPLSIRRWHGGPYRAQFASTMAGSGLVHGVLREEIVVDEDELVLLPGHLGYAAGATLASGAVAAYRTLTECCQAAAGQTIVLAGTHCNTATVLQLALALQLRTVVVSDQASLLAYTMRAGAWATVDAAPGCEVVLSEICRDWQADHLLLTGCAHSGGSTGSLVAISGLRGKTSPQRHIIDGGARIHFERMNALLAAHSIKPQVESEFAFAAARDAYAQYKAGAHVGHTVILMD